MVDVMGGLSESTMFYDRLGLVGNTWNNKFTLAICGSLESNRQ
jgi:hypothetical protein